MNTKTKTAPRKRRSRAKIRGIVLQGRIWFDRANGNSYHTTAIFVNHKFVHKTETQYGYGDQYVQTGFEWLEKNGYLKNTESFRSSSGSVCWWDYCRTNGIETIQTSHDVLKREL